MCAKIMCADARWKSEPLNGSLGFKGNAVTELWQVICDLQDANGVCARGLGVQSVLWSDAKVFRAQGERRGNEEMFALTCAALNMLRGRDFFTPAQALKEIMPALCRRTAEKGYSHTFLLNALTGVDLALWQLWRQNSHADFYQLAGQITGALKRRQPQLLNVPLISYSTPLREVETFARQGRGLLKIKLGANGRDMVARDVERMREIDSIAAQGRTVHTRRGVILYYLDLNGRYESRAQLCRLMDALDKAGVLEKVILLEEPFQEPMAEYVGDFPLRIAADESACTREGIARLIRDMGYGAVALKPIAKTLSLSLDFLEIARENGAVCYCADLTVNPRMVRWNQCVAAGLEPLPEMNVGVIESNGAQNYRNWRAMLADSDDVSDGFDEDEKGVFHLGERFFQENGGIWKPFPLCGREG